MPSGILSIGVLLNDTPSPSLGKHLDFSVNLTDTGIIGHRDVLVELPSSVSDSIAGEDGLIIALAKEVGVDEGRNERILESNGTKEDADENDQFSICNDLHGSVIVGCNTVRKMKSKLNFRRIAYL